MVLVSQEKLESQRNSNFRVWAIGTKYPFSRHRCGLSSAGFFSNHLGQWGTEGRSHFCDFWTSILPSDRTRAVTFFLGSSCSGLEVSAAPTKGIRTHIGGHEVTLRHTPWPAQQVCQPMGNTGGSLAASLLGRDADLQDGVRRKELSVGGWRVRRENCPTGPSW